MKTITEPTVFATTTEFTKIPTRRLTKFIKLDVTPSVKDNEWFQCINTVGTVVTQFDDGQECQRLHILGDGFTTVKNNANIITNTGADKLLVLNKVYRFTNFNRIWVEDV